jgi:hypothetical protein
VGGSESGVDAATHLLDLGVEFVFMFDRRSPWKHIPGQPRTLSVSAGGSDDVAFFAKVASRDLKSKVCVTRACTSDLF